MRRQISQTRKSQEKTEKGRPNTKAEKDTKYVVKNTKQAIIKNKKTGNRVTIKTHTKKSIPTIPIKAPALRSVKIDVDKETEIVMQRITDQIENRISSKPLWAEGLQDELSSIKADINSIRQEIQALIRLFKCSNLSQKQAENYD